LSIKYVTIYEHLNSVLCESNSTLPSVDLTILCSTWA